MLEMEDKVILNDDVVVTELEGEAVLLNLNTKMYYTLNKTGLFIWKRLGEKLSFGEIEAQLQYEYEVTPDKARQSVLDLVNHLHGEKLVKLNHG